MTQLIKRHAIVTTPGSPYIPAYPGQSSSPGYFVTTSYPVKTTVYGNKNLGNGAFAFNVPLYSYTTTETSKRWVPPRPYIAPTPAVAAVPPTSQDLGIGWNGGADTIAHAVGTAVFTFRVPAAAVGVAVGLSDTRALGDYRNIKHGVYASRGRLQFIKNGVVSANSIAYTSDTPIVIRRAGDTVTFTVEGAKAGETTTSLTGEVFGTAALYMPNDRVVDATLLSNVRAVSAATMLPMRGEGYAGPYAISLNAMLPMTAQATGRQRVGAHGTMLPLFGIASNRPSGYSMGRMETLHSTSTGQQFSAWSDTSMPPMVGMGANRVYGASITRMEPMTSQVYTGLVTPQIGTSFTSMPFVLGFGLGTTGGIGGSDASMRPLRGFGADRPYGYSEASFATMEGITGLFAFIDGEANLTAPFVRVRGQGRSSLGDNSFMYDAPMPTLAAFGGGVFERGAPSPSMTITATVVNWGRADLLASRPTIESTGAVSHMGNAALLAPTPDLVGYSGAVASITVGGRVTVVASGTTGSKGGATITCPLFELTAVATMQNYGSADLLAPAARLGAQAQAWLVAPSATLTAIGLANVTATYEAYAVNLNHPPPARGQAAPHDEVTRYTNFPFTHVVRYQNSYYGANSTGLYLLEGTTDDGASIAWAMKTAMDDFDEPLKKTIDSAYFGGRFGPASTVQLHAGERAPNTYSYNTPRDALAQNHRQTFGRGVKERYYALGASGTGAVEIDTIELAVRNTTRRI